MLDTLQQIEHRCVERIASYDGTGVVITHGGFQLEVYEMIRLLAKRLRELNPELS